MRRIAVLEKFVGVSAVAPERVAGNGDRPNVVDFNTRAVVVVELVADDIPIIATYAQIESVRFVPFDPVVREHSRRRPAAETVFSVRSENVVDYVKVAARKAHAAAEIFINHTFSEYEDEGVFQMYAVA